MAKAKPKPKPKPQQGPKLTGGAQSLYQQMGGQTGTNMNRQQFNKWYNQQSQQAGTDLAQYVSSYGLTPGTIAQSHNAPMTAYGAHATTNLPFTAGSSVMDFRNPTYLNDQGELYWMNKQLGTNYGSLAEAQNALALSGGMAGVQQFRTNVAGEGGENLPLHLRNVSASDARFNPQSWELIFNSLTGMKPKTAQEVVGQWGELVQPWMTEVDKKLRDVPQLNAEGQASGQKGIPFGFELLMSPGVNLTDKGSVFPAGADHPASLLQFTGGQAGETNVLRSLSTPELMENWWPLYNAQYNRPAGSPAPFEAGLTFGSPVRDPQTSRYTRSPLMGYNDEMLIDPQQAILEGYAGRSVPESELIKDLGGGYYNRYQAYDQERYMPEWNAFRRSIGLPPEDFWSLKEYAPFQNLPPEVLARIMAVINNPTGPGQTIGA